MSRWCAACAMVCATHMSSTRGSSHSQRFASLPHSKAAKRMLKVLSNGWQAGWSSRTTADNSINSNGERISSHAAVGAGPVNNDHDNDDEPPMFPMPGSIQRAGASTKPPIKTERSSVAFNVSPPSPSTSSSSRASSPPTPRASASGTTMSIASVNRSKPSHKPFPTEPDAVTQQFAAPTLALPPSTTAVPPKRSKKVALKPGHSALDWARLTRESGDELRAGFDTPQRITLAELAEHRKRDDAWSVFNGKVYNITPYLHYHPGGVGELMRVAGRDGTELFMKTHAWVNADLMLESCLVGFLVGEPPS